MCFSASASFLVSGSVAAAGVASIGRAKPNARLFASIPLFFSAQQFIEGLQWLTAKPGLYSLTLGYAYLFFAFLLWPTLMPIAVYKLETNVKRKRILRWFIVAGAAVTAFLLGVLLTQTLDIRVLPNGLDYHIRMPAREYGALIYAAVVCGSCLMSSKNFLRWFGLALAGSAAVTWIVLQHTFVSMWCFSAAVLSIFVYFVSRPPKAAHL